MQAPHCVLCPVPAVVEESAPLSALDCLKPTEQNKYVPASLRVGIVLTPRSSSYVHLICSVWHPEIRFTKSPYVVAEAVCLIPDKRRLQVSTLHEPPVTRGRLTPSLPPQTCSICNIKDVGACISCTDCKKVFHVSCAWKSGFKFGFEMQPLRKKRPKEVASIKFKDEDGALLAVYRQRTRSLTRFDFHRDDGAVNLVSRSPHLAREADNVRPRHS